MPIHAPSVDLKRGSFPDLEVRDLVMGKARSIKDDARLNATFQRLVCVAAFCSVIPAVQAQNPPGARSEFLPLPVSQENFTDLRERSPFVRHLNVSGSLVLTGIARIEDDVVATMVDLETFQSFLVSRETSVQGWQLVEVSGDPSDIETLTARIRFAGAEVVSVRYDDAPVPVKGMRGVAVSTRIGNGKPGGGTGPHGGPDPRVLTPDQLDDARNAARNIRDGFQADGYPDKQTIPPEVVSKISRLSVSQRESINVKMYEYRNRGLGLPERQSIYNRLLDRELSQK